MNLSRILPWRTTENRQTARGPYTDAIVSAIIAARGSKPFSSIETAAAEIAAGVIGRAFGTSRIDVSWATPAVLTTIARDMILTGESVWVLRMGELLPVGTFEIFGRASPKSWRYRVQLHGPSGVTESMSISRDSVLHARYSYDRVHPWTGVGPLQRATYAAELVANIEGSLRGETSGPVGYLLPIPVDGMDSTVENLKADLASLNGRIAVVETTAAGWGEGRLGAPRADFLPQRIGPNPPPSMPQIHAAIQTAVLAMCGVPVELVAPSEGTGQREAWRRFLHGTIQPIGSLVATEISRLAGRELEFDHERLFASDIAGRARAFQSLVGAGMTVGQAAAQSGLIAPEDS